MAGRAAIPPPNGRSVTSSRPRRGELTRDVRERLEREVDALRHPGSLFVGALDDRGVREERLTRGGEVVAENLLDVAEVVQERVECLDRDRQRLDHSVQVRPHLRATGVAELAELRVAHLALLLPPRREVVV